MVKFAIVKASELGNCWSAARFCVGCQACKRYDTCKYPERKANHSYDAAMLAAKGLRKLSEKLKDKARAMEQNQRSARP